MNKLKLQLFLICLFLAIQVKAFDGFEVESEKVGIAVGCEEPRIRLPSLRWSGLYSCVGGEAGNVKVTVTEEPETGDVSEVALTWSDWRQDTGYGIRPSRQTARAWANAIASMYAPAHLQQLTAAFSSNQDLVLETEKYVVQFTYRVGPSIDERRLAVSEKNGL
jgi:hypothetical protein